MADSDLDSFFAKRDKKKKTTTKKASHVTPEEIAKQLEDAGADGGQWDSSGYQMTERQREESSVVERLGLAKPEEEWDEVGDEFPDYSGLKIQTMTVRDKEEEMAERRRMELEEEKRLDEVSGTWSKMAAGPTVPTTSGSGGGGASSSAVETDPVPAEDSSSASGPTTTPTTDQTTKSLSASGDLTTEVSGSGKTTPTTQTSDVTGEGAATSPETPAAAAPAAPAKYVPPAQRGGGGGSASSSAADSPATIIGPDGTAILAPVRLSATKRAGTKKDEAPKLESEMDFPALG